MLKVCQKFNFNKPIKTIPNKKRQIMKKILYFLLATIIFAGCVEPQGPIPPRLYITPEDNEVPISLVNPVIFEIRGKSDEDMQKFYIRTDPFIYSFDTVFPEFVHEFNYNAEIKLPENISPFPEDSTITIQFVLEDAYARAAITKKLIIKDAFPDLNYDTVTLNFPDGAFFYNVMTQEALDTSADNGSFDLVFAYDNTLGATIASPDAMWLENVCVQNQVAYSTAEQRHTIINASQVDFNSMDDRFMYNLEVNPNYINGNQAYGIGVDGLTTGSVFVFELQGGNKGAAKVLSVSPTSITLAVKVQYKPQ